MFKVSAPLAYTLMKTRSQLSDRIDKRRAQWDKFQIEALLKCVLCNLIIKSYNVAYVRQRCGGNFRSRWKSSTLLRQNFL